MTPEPRREPEVYSRLGSLEARVKGAENDISGLKGELDVHDGRITSLEETRTFLRGAKWILGLLTSGTAVDIGIHIWKALSGK